MRKESQLRSMVIVRDLSEAKKVSGEDQEIVRQRWGEAPSWMVRLIPREVGVDTAATIVDKFARSLAFIQGTKSKV